MAIDQDTGNAILDRLDELCILFRAAFSLNIKKNLETVLDTDEKKLAYHLSDGRGTAEILNQVKMSSKTIPKLWRIWHGLGWGVQKDVPGGKRFVRVFSLDELGIELPKIVKEKE
jgi:hypothetical protein